MSRVVLNLPPGIVGDDTTFAATGRYSDCDNVRFWRGRAQVIGGWEKLVSTALTGVCREIFGWMDNSSALNLAFGTNAALQVWTGGVLNTITPLGPLTRLGNNPLTVTNGSPLVTVSHTAHGLTTGDQIIIDGSTAVGGITPNGTFTITVLTVDTYRFTFGSNATSGATGGGGSVLVIPLVVLPVGAIDGTGGAGIGTGAYSVGTYSTPSTSEYYPRSWSFGNYGQNLLASPRGGAIYIWENDTSQRATAIPEAPTQNNYMMVFKRQVFAFGSNLEASPYTFDPLVIRTSSIEAYDEWNTSNATTAREYKLQGGGRIVAAGAIGDNIAVWTTSNLYIGTYVGAINQVWRWDAVGEECGLAGPNAFTIVGQQAFWVGPNHQFYTYTLGNQAQILDCPIREGFADNLTAAQNDKISASSNSFFAEIRFDYPDARDGVECSRYVAAHVPTLMSSPENAWYRGTMARTAFMDAPPSPNSYPVATDPSGNIYWHEKGHSADGASFSWFLETADNFIDPNLVMMVRGVWPDFKDQIGPVIPTVTTRFYPQGDQTSTLGGTMGPGDNKSDVRATGRLARIRYAGEAAPTYVRIGNPTFDVTPTSQR